MKVEELYLQDKQSQAGVILQRVQFDTEIDIFPQLNPLVDCGRDCDDTVMSELTSTQTGERLSQVIKHQVEESDDEFMTIPLKRIDSGPYQHRLQERSLQVESCAMGQDSCPLRQENCPIQLDSCLIQESCPMRQDSCPNRQESCPMRQESCPIQTDSYLMQQESCPMRQDSCPNRQASCPMQQESCPMRQDSCTNRQESCPMQQESCNIRPDSYLVLPDPTQTELDARKSSELVLPTQGSRHEVLLEEIDRPEDASGLKESGVKPPKKESTLSRMLKGMRGEKEGSDDTTEKLNISRMFHKMNPVGKSSRESFSKVFHRIGDVLQKKTEEERSNSSSRKDKLERNLKSRENQKKVAKSEEQKFSKIGQKFFKCQPSDPEPDKAP